MDRREMLKESFRGLAQSLPTILGLAGGLGNALTGKDEVPVTQPAACFPKPSKEPHTATPHEESCEKE